GWREPEGTPRPSSLSTRSDRREALRALPRHARNWRKPCSEGCMRRETTTATGAERPGDSMTNTLPIDDNGSPSKAAPKEGRYDVGGYSDAGRRRATNEDCYLIASFHRSLHVIDSNVQTRQVGWSPGPLFGTLLMVADGMGGHSGGDIASQSAVAAVADYLTNVLPGATTMVESLPQDARSSLHGLRAQSSSEQLVWG